MIKKRILSCLTLILLAAMLLSSCAGNQGNAETPSETLPTTESFPETLPETTVDPYPVDPDLTAREASERRIAALVNRDLSGDTVIIATVSAKEVVPFEAVESDPILSSRYDCKRTVEQKYHTQFLVTETPFEEFYQSAKTAELSQLPFADLLVVPHEKLGALLADDLLANVRSLPFVSCESKYYNQNLSAMLKVGYQLPAVGGAATENVSDLNCLFFNASLLNQLGLSDPYALVKSGDWTWDTFRTYSRAALGNSFYPCVTALSQNDLIDLASLSMGFQFVTKENGLPRLAFGMDADALAKANAAVTTLFEYYYQDNTLMTLDDVSAKTAFTGGQALFCLTDLSFAAKLTDVTLNWGVLPLPKQDSSQDGYVTPVSKQTPVLCALAKTPSYEISGLILEAFSAGNYDYAERIFYDTCFDWTLHSEDALRMMDLINASRSYDHATLLHRQFSHLEDATYGAIRGAVTSAYSFETLFTNHYESAANELIKAYPSPDGE